MTTKMPGTVLSVSKTLSPWSSIHHFRLSSIEMVLVTSLREKLVTKLLRKCLFTKTKEGGIKFIPSPSTVRTNVDVGPCVDLGTMGAALRLMTACPGIYGTFVHVR